MLRKKSIKKSTQARKYGYARLDRDSYRRTDFISQCPEGNANLIISALDEGRRDMTGHAPCIDLDYDCALVPSRTPGHFHLYLNKEVEWDKYVAVLEAMANAGLIEKEYYKAALRQGFSVLRMPPKEFRFLDIQARLDRGEPFFEGENDE